MIKSVPIKIHIIFSFVILFCVSLNAQTERYKVFEKHSDTLLNAYLLNRLKVQFDQRRLELKKASLSEKRLFQRRDRMRDWFIKAVGILPSNKTPLNPIVTKKKDMGTYTIEMVAFESMPNHHVTGVFYLPKTGKVPYPGIYIPSGHSLNGKANETYQKAARLFAVNGFAVFQADPISKGERYQYLDENGAPVTDETGSHEILGQSLLLTGSNSLIWQLEDNIRCVDFLEQHPYVDKNKLAVAGNSGGGTQATYLAAFDRRIKVATPSCYIATTEKKFFTIGSQDGCQQLWGEGKRGIEEQDFLFMAAPIPILILSAEKDFFAIEGAKTAYRELKNLYTILQLPDKIDQVTCSEEHGWHKPLREASVQWCKRWLMNDPSPVTEPNDIGYLEDKEIQVTRTGQVLTSFKNEKSVIDINEERLKTCDQRRFNFQKNHSSSEIIKKIKNLIGFEDPLDNGLIKHLGIIKENGYHVEKILINRDHEYEFFLPALLFIPDSTKDKRPAVIIASEKGKESELGVEGLVQDELNKGHIVLAIDVCNTGELKDQRLSRYNNNEFYIAKMALYEGKTLMTYRAEDLLVAYHFLKSLKLVDKSDINLISVGYIGPAALHAAVIGQCFRQVKIIDSLVSWKEVAISYKLKDQLANIVPDVLNYYDLPDLIMLMPKSGVEFAAAVDASGNANSIGPHQDGTVKLTHTQVCEVFDPAYIKGLMDRNAAYFRDEVFSKVPLNPKLISWNGAVYYSGLLEAWKYTGKEDYLEQMTEVCNNFRWKLFPEHQNSTANNLLIGDVYLNMYLEEEDTACIADLKKEIKRIVASEFTGGDYWWWVDALFMGPPTFTLLSQVAGDPEYLDFMHQKWQLAYNRELYNEKEHLFYRDSNWVYNPNDPKTCTSSGGKIFWSRGNGWAVGGICRLLNYLPEGHPYGKFYRRVLRKTLKSIAKHQQQDGLWTTNLVDQKDFPGTETSGSALFCYAMAWGINNGIVSRKKYEPVVRKTWMALVKCIQPEGDLGQCQVEAHSPGKVSPTDTDWFGQGLFLLASTEVLRMTESK